MIYGKTPFADLQAIGKLHAIVNPKHEIKYPAGFDAAAIDAIKRCLQRNPSDRSPIVHDEVGLLNAHIFLKSNDGT
jgi:serine/threonine-protein kinase TTK/MPS1